MLLLFRVQLPCFNPRTHTGCDSKINGILTNGTEFQSTHPHGVRRETAHAYGQCTVVSIHAPTRGATCFFRWRCSRLPCFNPRTHTGCDAGFTAELSKLVVSIHAPTRGATYSVASCCPSKAVSIHAPTRGATKMHAVLLVLQISFNPRTHTGCDNALLDKQQTWSVSIHAPTRGATFSCKNCCRFP